MAAPQRLQSANISPSARPVDTFLQYDANPAPAQPAQLAKLPQVKGIQSFQRGGRRDVQGVNPFEELATALAPLSKLYDAGVEMYASDQYRQGQNEILRAASNVNRDTIIKGLQYTEDNRQLSRENPVAGVLMDQANPFRQAGRVNQASQWVGGLTPQLFKAEWVKKGGDLSKLDPSDPAVLQVKADVTGRIAGYFGLDEFSPGFQQYVIPQINRSSDWFTDQQIAGHTKYQKTVGVKQASDQMTSMLFDPRTTPESWNSMLLQFGSQFGITGEPQEMVKEAILRSAGELITISGDLSNPGRQQALAALEVLKNLPSGVQDANGIDIPVGRMYGPDILSEAADVTRDLKTLREGRVAIAEEALQDDLDLNTDVTMSPQEIARQFQIYRAKPEYDDLSDAELWNAISGRSDAAQEYQEAMFDQDAVEDFFLEQEFALGSDWDEAAAGRRFRELIDGAPRTLQKELQNRWRALRNQKQTDTGGEIDSTVMRDSLKNSTSAILNTILPEGGIGMIKAAKAAGIPLMTWIQKFEPAKFEAIQKIRNELQKRAANRIRQETAEKKRKLRPEEQSQIFTDVMTEVLGDEKLMKSFSPMSASETQTQSRGGPDRSGTQTTEEKPEPPTYYNTSQAVPEEVVRSGKPIYKPSDTMGLLLSAANGKPLPGNVKRAARAAGMTTGQFLLKQAQMLGISIPPPMREKVERVARVEQGVSDSIASAAPRSNDPLSYASNAVFNILSGTAPAVAVTRRPSVPTAALGAPAALSSFSPQVSSITYDTGQPGIDVFFENKQFPAVLSGRVKEVGFQGGVDSGYGHFLVIESIDPATGAPVDVIYGHLASGSTLSPGQRIEAGQIIGRQGGTGRVRSADGTIASIDFLAPAPAGSRSMTPYSNYEQLRRSIAQQLRN